MGQEGFSGPTGGLGGVGRPSWRDGKGQEVVPKGREESGVSPSVAERESEGPPRGLGGAGMGW